MELAFNGDGSEYAWQLKEAFEKDGDLIKEFRTSEDLIQIIGEMTRLILIVNPTPVLLKKCVQALGRSGGKTKKTPLIAAFSAPIEVPDEGIFAIADDFVIQPARVDEIVLRADVHRRKMYGSGRVIQRQNLIINVDNH